MAFRALEYASRAGVVDSLQYSAAPAFSSLLDFIINLVIGVWN